ncbi:PadR family transcriptional regulator [Haladaptatus pallidirubidus]|uniref:Transcription regulator PadR N-terminal domain-containing protein n=1 Tax=Haladaptatus pallidirubidus TaxID=1008152 RepID=A0AAV3UHU0_9EURY|nr:helix-turn-helix transcriptional regulator [Haladaptatus pallidirubidus]
MSTEPAFADVPSFRRDLLAVIAREEPVYGLAAKRALETAYDDTINNGQLYRHLDALVEENYVQKSQLDRRTNEYSVTDSGRETLKAQITWLESCLTNGENIHE